MGGFKSFGTTAITLAGIELAHRIRKRQFSLGRGWVAQANLGTCTRLKARPKVNLKCRFLFGIEGRILVFKARNATVPFIKDRELGLGENPQHAAMQHVSRMSKSPILGHNPRTKPTTGNRAGRTRLSCVPLAVPSLVAKEEAMSRLDMLWLEVTNVCNLECIHCYSNSGPYRDTVNAD
jgi:hypothetical protein